MQDEGWLWIDNPEHSITLEQLGELNPDEQREYVLAWFYRMFEDPANETPYQSSEGGYIYIWGGPYDAHEQIADQFHTVLSEELIEEIAEEVQSDGTYDWAPGREHPDHVKAAEDFEETFGDEEPDFEGAIEQLEGGASVQLGDDAERDVRKELAEGASELIEILDSMKPTHGGMGHNGPPIDDEGNPLPVEFEEGLREAATAISEQAESDEPDALEIAKASNRLVQLMGWLKPKLDIATDEFAKGFGKTLGVGAATVVSGGLAVAVSKLLGLSWDWLSLVLLLL